MAAVRRRGGSREGCRRLDGGKVRGVETADEHGFDFASVEFEKHAVDAVLNHARAEIGVATHAVCAAAMCGVFWSITEPLRSSALVRANASGGSMSKNDFLPPDRLRLSYGSRGGRESGW